jgi:hypothetical protein
MPSAQPPDFEIQMTSGETINRSPEMASALSFVCRDRDTDRMIGPEMGGFINWTKVLVAISYGSQSTRIHHRTISLSR